MKKITETFKIKNKNVKFTFDVAKTQSEALKYYKDRGLTPLIALNSYIKALARATAIYSFKNGISLCRRCNKKLQKKQKFCSNCGAKNKTVSK